MEPDQRDVGATLSVTHKVGNVSLSLGGTRDWFLNNRVTGLDVITSSVLVGANWTGPTYFQLNSNLSVNWTVGDPAKVGGTRNITAYVLPTLNWKRTGLQLAPLISVNNVRTQLNTGVLTADTLTGQYGGRLSWTMPGFMKISTLAMQGAWTSNRNNLTGTDMRASQLLGVWTVVWGRKTGS